GRVEAALSAARALSRPQPQEALVWAERARTLDPARQEAWTLSIDLHARLHQYDGACTLCAEAAPWFIALPDKRALQDKLAELRREEDGYEGARQRELEPQMRERTVPCRLR